MKFYIYTLGCKVNAYESEVIKEQFLANGYTYSRENPDVIVVNTCSVTNIADQKSRKMVRRFKKNHPNAILIVCGCSSENDAVLYDTMDIDILLGNSYKSNIVNLLEAYLENHQKIKKILNTRDLPFEDMQVDKFATHTRAFVKIEDGCDNFCSYCIIPYVRGRRRDKDYNLAIKEITTLVSNGHQEIVLTGIHTGSFGLGTNHDLTDLIQEISKLDNLKRIRISSIEITEINDKFLNELKNNPKICNHLHIPLQAGSDEILKKMNRKYTLAEFKEKIKKIRNIRNDISITTDVIVGFPGETIDLFNKTLETVKEINFSKVHVFPYSIRKGTPASVMACQVDSNEKHRRSKVLCELSKELEGAYYQKFVGTTLSILVESDGIGVTSNYLRVKCDGITINNIEDVKITNYDGEYLRGMRR